MVWRGWFLWFGAVGFYGLARLGNRTSIFASYFLARLGNRTSIRTFIFASIRASIVGIEAGFGNIASFNNLQ